MKNITTISNLKSLATQEAQMREHKLNTLGTINRLMAIPGAEKVVARLLSQLEALERKRKQARSLMQWMRTMLTALSTGSLVEGTMLSITRTLNGLAQEYMELILSASNKYRLGNI